MKSLLSVSLILLSFSSSSTSELFSERNDDCTTSSSFLIKNDSPNAKKPYLTLDLKKNSLSGGKLSKGKPKKNQIWTWVNCGEGDFLSSQVDGKLLSVNEKALSVVDAVSNSPAVWIYDSEFGTLRDVQSKKYVRLLKRKSRVALAKKLKLMKKGPEKGKPWGWFRWTLEFLDSDSGSSSGSDSGSGSGSDSGSGSGSDSGSGSGSDSGSGSGSDSWSGSGSDSGSGSGSDSGSSSGSGSGWNTGSGSGSEPGCVDCRTINGTACQFPFYYNGNEYNACIPGETPWCATKVDGAGNLLHFQGSSAWGYCESTCPTYTDPTVACPHSEPAFPEECEARHNSTHKNVLFLGNSYTGGCNGIDSVVRQIAEGAGFSATTERSSPGGKTLNWHASNSLNRIKNGDWDAVVLQDQSQRPSFGAQYVYSYILPDVLTLVQTMKETNVCTLPVFFQTWGKRDGDTGNCSPAPYDALCTFEGVQDQLTQAYNTMAYVSQPAKVAPAGEAWRTYSNRNSLFANDGSHATCSGTFLAACTIFQQIWGVPCSASTYSPVADAAALKEQADAIVAAGSGAAAEPEPWSWPSNGPPCPGCLGMAR